MKRTALLALIIMFFASVGVNARSVTAQTAAAWRINAGGGDFTDGNGHFFVADKAYTAADFGYTGSARPFTFSDPVAGTDDDALYQTMRASYVFGYDFDVPNGDYEVTLHFMEPWQSAPGERLMDVTIEGVLALDDYDIFVEAGGQYTAVSETIAATVSDGTLNIEFNRVNRVAVVSAIEVVSAGPVTPEPDINVSPTALAFGDVTTGAHSDLLTTITNDGTADLTISALTTTDAAFSVVSPAAPLTLPPGDSADVTVRFSPTVAGAAAADLQIASDDPDEALVLVALSGSGVAPPPNEPDISVNPTAVNFGAVTTGTSADQVVTITNAGAVTLTVSSLAASGAGFSVVSPAAPFDVAPGANQAVTVRFSPAADGPASGNLQIDANDPDEPTVNVSLDGEGVSTPALAMRINAAGPDYTTSGGALFVADKAYSAGDFGYVGNGRPFTFADAIAGTDDDALYQTLRASFVFGYDFDVPNGDYNVTLHFMEPWQSAAGERLFDVSMEGIVVLDDYDIFVEAGGALTAVSETIPVSVSDGTLNIEFNRVNRVAMVSAISVVSASSGPPAPEISVTPASLAFGGVVTGQSSDLNVTINNGGTADLTISSLTTTDAAFTVVSPTTPLVVVPGGSQAVTVRFSPTAIAAYSGDLEIVSDDADETLVSVALSGSGVDTPPQEPDISVSPTSLSFGSVTVGGATDRTTTITNNGAVTLTVSSLSTTNGVYSVVSPAAPLNVAPNGGTQVVTVRFAPTAVGTANGSLEIVSNDPDEGMVAVSLSGSGAAAAGNTYTDVTSQVGINASHDLHTTVCAMPPLSNGSAWGDYDNDGDVDLYITNHGGANYLYRNDGDTSGDGLPNFTNVAASLGVENAALLSLSAVFIDYDNDGDQDLYVTNWDGNTLFQNQLIETGTVAFIDVTAAAGVADAGRAITTAWADFNEDGYLDFYVAKHRRCSGDDSSEDHLYMNNGDGTFSNVTSYLCNGAANCAQVLGLGFSPVWFDYDNDGDLDLFLVNDDIGGAYEENVLWRNDGSDGAGGWTFTDVSAASGLDISLNGMGLGMGDFNNDGLFDVAFSNMAPAMLMQNNGDGAFSDVSGASGVTAATIQPTWGTAFLDYDNDGWLDLYFVAGGVGANPSDHRNVLLRNDANGTTFTNVSSSSGVNDPGWGRSAALADFDGDGWVDILIGNYSDGYYLFRNDSAAQSNGNGWLTVTVEGSESNRDGIGTRLLLTAGGVTQMREINTGPTHGGGDHRAAYFGLGGNASGTLVIEWPNGVTQNVGTVNAGQQLHFVEPPNNPPATTFEDVTALVDMNPVHSLHGSVCGGPPLGSGSAWADYDNDGDQDVFITNHGGANYLYRNDGDTDGDGLPNFTNVAASAGVDLISLASLSAVFIDYDNDGDQDLYVTNWDGNTLFENQLVESGSATFTDVTTTAGVADAGRAITSAWADFNNDGYLDLYVAKHMRCAGDPQSQDHLFQSNGDGTFTDVTSYLCGGAASCAAVAGLGFSPSFFDYDNDGDLDLFLVNDDIGGTSGANVLWRNDGPDGSGGWTFTDVSAAANMNASVNGMGLGVGDFNNDGWLDAAYSNLAPARLVQNNGDGTFTDVSSVSGVSGNTPHPTWGTVFFDHDNDGDLDLYFVAGDVNVQTADRPNVLLSNDNDGTFSNVSAASGLDNPGRGRSASIADFDGDGWIDVMVGNYAEGYFLYRNRSTDQGNANNWLAITVEGTESNRDGIGARLYLTVGGVTQIREINTGPTHGGGDQRLALFGLGAAGSGTLEVRWPNGVMENLGVVTANQQMHLVEPATPVPDVDAPATLDFGNVETGTSRDKQVAISNVGAFTLTISALTTTNGVFTVQSPTTPVDVAPGGSVNVTVRLSPTADGAQNGDLEVASNDPDEPLIAVALTGVGVTPASTTYVDVAGDVGLVLDHTLASICNPPIGSGSAWADFDNDGDIDLFVTNHGAANRLYRNDGDTDSDGLPNYTNVAAALGVDDPAGVGHAAVFIDYDNDGDQDLYVSSWGYSRLYQNQLIETGSVAFVDVSASAGLTDDGRVVTAAWADFDNDGWLDLYIAKHAYCGGTDPRNGDKLYRSNGDGTFSDVTHWLCTGCDPIDHSLGFSAGWFDYDNDGDLDLYLVNDVLQGDGSGGSQNYHNVLWRNDGPDGSGGWIFTDVSTAAGVDKAVNGMGLGIGDYNNDGFFDIAFSDIGASTLYQNNGDGSFADVSGPSKAGTGSLTWGTAFFDHDNDGWLDLFFVSGLIGSGGSTPDIFLRNNADGTFTDISVSSGLNNPGRGRNASIVDFDQDGLVDVFVGNYGGAPALYHNRADTQGNTNNWLTITVEGTDSNRDGIGTRLILTTADGTQIREINSGPTHGGGDYRAAYFGLGSEASGTLTIQWPNGVVENVGTVTSNQSLHRVEPPSAPAPTTTFVDVTGQVGMNLTHTLSAVVCAGPPLGSGAAWADYDNDGDIDVFATNHGGANWLYRNDGDTNGNGLPNYTDVAVALGVDDAVGVGLSAVFIDYDNDGDQDLYVTNWNDGTQPHGNVLYENQLVETGSVSFVDVTATAGLANNGRAITAGWADFNNDGYLDVYLAKHTSCGADPTVHLQDHLFQNNGDGTFSDVSHYLCTSTGGTLPCPTDLEGRGFSPGWFDYDNDGDQDLYLVNDINASTNPNRMWRNDGPDGSGGWIFTEVSTAAGTDLAVNGMGLGIGDVDNDGWLDLAFSDVGTAHFLQNNQDGTYNDLSGTSGQPNGVTWGTAFFDYDNDGWLDLFYASGSIHDPNNNPADVMLRNRGGDGFLNTFADVSASTGLDHNGRGRHVSIVDFDGDGWVDVMVGNYGQDYRLYKNYGTTLGNGNNWLAITVEGTDSNRDGIGTRLILTTADGTQIREINSGPTHGGGDYRAAYFGLGGESSGTLTVEWPNGEVQNLGTVTAGQQLHLVEPAAP